MHHNLLTKSKTNVKNMTFHTPPQFSMNCFHHEGVQNKPETFEQKGLHLGSTSSLEGFNNIH